MDKKDASTFPFHNLPPEPKKTSQRSFLCFLTFPEDKIKKSAATLAKPNKCEHKHEIPKSVLSPYHRTGESAGE